MKISAVFATFALAFAASLPAVAQQAPAAAPKAAAQPLEIRLEARKVVRAADGKETLVAADAARPGDVIEYATTYRNTSAQRLTNLEATLPLPPNTEFIPGSANPATARASADGRNFLEVPLKRRVMRNGVEIEEQVPLRDYRSLRWYPGALEGGKAVTYTARVRVVDDRTPSEPGSKGGGK